jgi:hypothetical protein
VEGKCNKIKIAVNLSAAQTLGFEMKTQRNDWYGDECKQVIEERNRARVKMLNRTIRVNVSDYKEKRRLANRKCRRKKRARDKEKMKEIEALSEKKEIGKMYQKNWSDKKRVST